MQDKQTSHFMINALKGSGFHLQQLSKLLGVDYHKLLKARNNEFELKESDYRKVRDFYVKNMEGGAK